MTRFALLPLAALALVACSDNPVANPPVPGPQLSSVHLKGGKNAKPAFFDGGLTLDVVASLSGLGNGDLFVGMDAKANTTAVCGNPGTNTFQAPGQNPAPTDVSGGVAIPGDEIKNGNLTFTVGTLVPPDAGPRAATKEECPSVSWTYEVTDLAFTEATFSVYQPSDIDSDPIVLGPLVFRMRCLFAPQTTNGAVPGLSVTCSEL